MKKPLLPVTAALVLLASVASIDACRASRQAPPAPHAGPTKAVLNNAIVDGGNPNDCGAKNATCGIWSCQSQSGLNCVTQQTQCVYSNGFEYVQCTSGTGLCCPTVCFNGTCTGDAAGIYDAGVDGTCPNPVGCQWQDTELSNSVLGTAAQQVPGGVFCPGANFSINSLTDLNNCGYCGHRCASGYTCLNGICGVP